MIYINIYKYFSQYAKEEVKLAINSLRTLIIYTFIFNEIISILENSSSLGIKISKALKSALEKLNQEHLK